MITTVKALGGKFFSQVRADYRDGGKIVFESPEYLTERMALADAECWLAFHGGEKKMDKVTVDMAEVYCARQFISQIMAEVPAEYVARHVDSAYKRGLTVQVKDGAMGQRYIEISDGGSSSYGQYHIGAAFRDAMVNKYQGKTMLTPRDTETFTRPERYGHPDYFGKVEIFDALDRETDEFLPYEVRRVDGQEVVVNGPKGLVLTGFTNLRDAVEAINERR